MTGTEATVDPAAGVGDADVGQSEDWRWVVVIGDAAGAGAPDRETSLCGQVQPDHLGWLVETVAEHRHPHHGAGRPEGDAHADPLL
ncbi:hypothetical protein [Nocardioides sp. AN3]